jgi:uncharacterized membrane protein YdjX (TVP38/TMEM64 family)
VTFRAPSPGLFRLGVVAFVLLGLALAHHLGVFAYLEEPRRLAQALVVSGLHGYAMFVLAYALLQPFGVPGTIFVVAAPLIWPWPAAFAVSMAGTMAASVVGFSFARFVARDWVSARIPARLRRYDEAIARHAFTTVVVLRLVLWMPQALHAFFGVSKVGFWTHFWGSIVGYAPTLLVVSCLGGEMFDASGQIRPGAWPVLAGLFITSLVVAAWARRSARSLERTRPSEAGDP